MVRRADRIGIVGWESNIGVAGRRARQLLTGCLFIATLVITLGLASEAGATGIHHRGGDHDDFDFDLHHDWKPDFGDDWDHFSGKGCFDCDAYLRLIEKVEALGDHFDEQETAKDLDRLLEHFGMHRDQFPEWDDLYAHYRSKCDPTSPPVPEPSTALLVSLGLVGLARLGGRRNHRA